MANAAYDTTYTDRLLAERPVWTSFANGEYLEAGDLATTTVYEAHSGLPLTELASSDEKTVEVVVRDSRRAFENGWSDTSPRERGILLRRLAERIRQEAEEIAELCAREVGKPKREALRVDLLACHAAFDYYASVVESLRGDILDQGVIEAHVRYEPYGVVAAIYPFNWPAIHFSQKAAPALAAGNTVVVKPGEQAPLTLLRLVEIANEILPPGVVNAVTGLQAGIDLISNPLVERVSFTGATDTGRAVLRTAAQNLTYTTLELGGKNAFIVRADADVAKAVDLAIEGVFYNQGEACTSTSRIMVHSSLYDDFAERFLEKTKTLVVGHPLHIRTDMGALVDAKQKDRVISYIEKGKAEGATLLYSGARPDAPGTEGGYFVAPHVFGDVTNDMTIAQEEIFGPVACLMKFDTDDQAVEMANDSEYGLTAAICSADETFANKMAQRINAGMIFINNYTRRSFVGSPFGGMKGSGFGREYALETMQEFLRAKNVRFVTGRGTIPTWPPLEV